MSFEESEDDLQIEVTANGPADTIAVTVTRSDKSVESVVCVPGCGRGRSLKRQTNDLRPDPERFKSPIKDGRHSALGQRVRQCSENGNEEKQVQLIPDDVDGCEGVIRRKNRRSVLQRFHLRVAYPNGFSTQPVPSLERENYRGELPPLPAAGN